MTNTTLTDAVRLSNSASGLVDEAGLLSIGNLPVDEAQESRTFVHLDGRRSRANRTGNGHVLS